MKWQTSGFTAVDKIIAKASDAPSSLELRQPSAEYEYFVARSELGNPTGNLSHGLAHLAELLTYDPACREWRDLLESYLARVPGQEECLIPEEQRGYYALEAVRAYIFARAGRLAEAVQILNAIAKAKPSVPYMDAWATEWLARAGAIESLPIEIAMVVVGRPLAYFGEFRSLTHRQLQYLSRYIELSVRTHVPAGRESLIAMTQTGLLRKAGRFGEALAKAEADLQKYPCWQTAMALALTLRAMGRTEEVDAAFKQALAFDPREISAYLEIADMYFNIGDWSRALAEYEAILKRQPGHPWAHPSAIWCRWKMAPDTGLEELIKLAASNQRAAGLLDEFRPYTGHVPEPHDALANVLRQILADVKAPLDQDTVNFRLSNLEAPSNQLPFKLALGCSLKIAAEKIPEPDPRVAIVPVRFPLWAYDGADASPALPPPSSDAAKEIAAIAMLPLVRDELWAAASQVAARLGESRAAEILSVMVHPPVPPAGVDVIVWVVRIQWTAAFVIAQLGSGWEGSPRRDALYSALLGPRDWATAAAIIACARLAIEMPHIAPDVGIAFEKLDEATPEAGYYHRHALYWNWLMLPHLTDREREPMREKLRALKQ